MLPENGPSHLGRSSPYLGEGMRNNDSRPQKNASEGDRPNNGAAACTIHCVRRVVADMAEQRELLEHGSLSPHASRGLNAPDSAALAAATTTGDLDLATAALRGGSVGRRRSETPTARPRLVC